MSAQPKTGYTLEEYLELERTAEERYEFWEGEVYAMSGGTKEHDCITGNMFLALSSLLRNKKCRPFTGNLQIKVPAALPYRYADGSVACDKIEYERFSGVDLLLNPVLLWEVLSPSTEAFNRGDKFTWYKSIASFREYLLIAQHRPHITHFVKQGAEVWSYEEINGLEASIHLPTIECTLTLAEIYQDVEFSQESSLQLLPKPSGTLIPY